MAWTTPRTWVALEQVTAALMNAHVRDNFNAVGDHSAWTSHTPTLTASSSNPTLGTGSIAVGEYIQTVSIVHYNFYIAFGTSGTGAGTGTYRVDLPVSAEVTAAWPVGGGAFFDNSGTDRYLLEWWTANTDYVTAYWDQQTDVGNLGAASPVAVSTEDTLSGNLVYQAA